MGRRPERSKPGDLPDHITGRFREERQKARAGSSFPLRKIAHLHCVLLCSRINMNRAYLIILFLFIQPGLKAQEREYNIREVKVEHSRNVSSGRQGDTLGARPLSSKPGIYLRAVSPVASAGLSVRAAAPAHTDVSWNGIPLSNPLLGQADVSLIAPVMLQQAVIREGGMAENGFCASFGGSLLLGMQTKQFKNHAVMGVSAGSFGQLEQHAKMGGRIGTTGGALQLWNTSGEWNYPVRMGNFTTRMKHQARHFFGAEGQSHWQTGKNHRLESGFWSQRSDRQLAGMLLEENPAGRQQDENHRFFLRQIWQPRRLNLQQQFAYSTDRLDFQDAKAGISSRAHSQGWFYRSEAGIGRERWRLKLQTHASLQQADAGQASGLQRQIRAGVGLLPEWNFPEAGIRIRPELRMECWSYPEANRREAVLLPALQVQWQKMESHTLVLGIFSRRRNPGLNDLYWPGAGNPQLLPESGFTSGLDWIWRIQPISGLFLRQETGLFHTRISDYILWMPQSIQWQPLNAGEARISGLSFRQLADYTISTGWKSSLRMEWQLSRQELSHHMDGTQKKSPMPFQPEIQASLQLRLEKGGFAGSLQSMYNGRRAIGFNSSGQMPAYQLLDAAFEWQGKIASRHVKLVAQACNLLNAHYHLLPAFPMPGRNFLLQLEIKF